MDDKPGLIDWLIDLDLDSCAILKQFLCQHPHTKNRSTQSIIVYYLGESVGDASSSGSRQIKPNERKRKAPLAADSDPDSRSENKKQKRGKKKRKTFLNQRSRMKKLQENRWAHFSIILQGFWEKIQISICWVD